MALWTSRALPTFVGRLSRASRSAPTVAPTDSPTARSLGQSQSVVGTIPNSALASTKNGVPAAMIWRGSFRGAKWLTYRLDVNDISSNSWSNDPCSEKEESRRRMQDVSG